MLTILIHFIINVIKLNSFYLGMMRTTIINPCGKFYDFMNNENDYMNDDYININNKIIGYSKVNLTDYKNMKFMD
jgi:hypothetical protein